MMTKDDDSDDDIDTDIDYDSEPYLFHYKDMVCSIKDCILLDIQSNINVFSNEKLLSNLLDWRRNLVLNCNTGKTPVTQ